MRKLCLLLALVLLSFSAVQAAMTVSDITPENIEGCKWIIVKSRLYQDSITKFVVEIGGDSMPNWNNAYVDVWDETGRLRQIKFDREVELQVQEIKFEILNRYLKYSKFVCWDYLEHPTMTSTSGVSYQFKLCDFSTVDCIEVILPPDGFLGWGEPLKYNMVSLKKEIVCKGDTVPSRYFISFEYPEFIVGTISGRINTLNLEVSRFWTKDNNGKTRRFGVEEWANHILSGWREYINNDEEAKRRSGWVVTNKAHILFNRPPIICMSFGNWSYTGGAHPNRSVGYMLRDIRNGMYIKLHDLVYRSKRDSLNVLGEIKFREANRIEPGVSLSDAHFDFPNDKFQLNENFAITNEGLLFTFNEYEVSSYSAGSTTITIPYEELQGVMKNGWYEILTLDQN